VSTVAGSVTDTGRPARKRLHGDRVVERDGHMVVESDGHDVREYR
jgi:hypothetical protein